MRFQMYIRYDSQYEQFFSLDINLVSVNKCNYFNYQHYIFMKNVTIFFLITEIIEQMLLPQC